MAGYLIVAPIDLQFRDSDGNNIALDAFDLIEYLAEKLTNPNQDVTIADYQGNQVILNPYTGLRAAENINNPSIHEDNTGLSTFNPVKKSQAYHYLVAALDELNHMNNAPEDTKRQINSNLRALTATVTMFSATPEAITVAGEKFQITCGQDKDRLIKAVTELQQEMTDEPKPTSNVMK